MQVGDPVPTAWKGRYVPVERDDPDLLGRPSALTPGHLAYGAAAFGGLFAAGWALSRRRNHGSAHE